MLECDIVLNEFKLHSHYYFHFRTNTNEKGMNPLIPTATDFNTAVLQRWIWHKKINSKVNMLLNKETTANPVVLVNSMKKNYTTSLFVLLELFRSYTVQIDYWDNLLNDFQLH